MPVYDFIGHNTAGKALTVASVKAALSALPDDALLVPSATTSNLTILASVGDPRLVGMIDFISQESGDSSELLEMYGEF